VVESDSELSVNADGEPVRGNRFEYTGRPGSAGGDVVAGYATVRSAGGA
jgi:hypothetical protein